MLIFVEFFLKTLDFVAAVCFKALHKFSNIHVKLRLLFFRFSIGFVETFYSKLVLLKSFHSPIKYPVLLFPLA